MNKVWSVVCSLVGALLACASLVSFWFIAGNPDGNGTLSLGEWVAVLFFVSLSIISFVGAWQLWRSDE